MSDIITRARELLASIRIAGPWTVSGNRPGQVESARGSLVARTHFIDDAARIAAMPGVILDLVEEVEKLRASPWRPISEAPKNGDWVMARTPGDDPYEARWRDETGRWEDWADYPVPEDAVFVPMPED